MNKVIQKQPKTMWSNIIIWLWRIKALSKKEDNQLLVTTKKQITKSKKSRYPNLTWMYEEADREHRFI